MHCYFKRKATTFGPHAAGPHATSEHRKIIPLEQFSVDSIDTIELGISHLFPEDEPNSPVLNSSESTINDCSIIHEEASGFVIKSAQALIDEADEGSESGRVMEVQEEQLEMATVPCQEA